ncbi:TIGR02679 domain-containing protein [Fusibacter sp. JL298sf-3]
METTNYDAFMAYLKSYDVERIMTLIRGKYCTYGAAKGNIVLKNSTDSERHFLRGLLKKDFSGDTPIKVHLATFESAFAETRFQGITLGKILEWYFNEPIQSNQEVSTVQKTVKNALLNATLRQLSSEDLKAWTTAAFNVSSHPGYRLINEFASNRNAVAVDELLPQLEKLLSLLNRHPEGLSFTMAAAYTTGYPHALDKEMPLRKLFTTYAKSCRPEMPFETLEEQEVLYEQFNISSDEVPRMVLTYGIDAYDDVGQSLGWETFSGRGEPLLLNKLNLRSAASVMCKGRTVWCFENPAAFYQFIQSNAEKSAVCTHGQPHLLDYMLLDRLYASGAVLRYSGDFDPEGLWIAERLKKRYPELDLSFFTVERYLCKRSKEGISAKRLKQLQLLETPQLRAVGDMMAQHKVAAYEEGETDTGH